MIRRLRDATEPTPEACERLATSFSGRSTHARLAKLPEPRGTIRLPLPRRSTWVLLPIALVATIVWAIWPSPPVSARLDATEDTTLALTPEVQLTFSGTGVADGTRAAPRIRWDVGELHVTVESGIALVVETAEGTASVHGTRFDVVRDALGTTVTVHEGVVAVSCGRDLAAGDTVTCLPLRPAGLLARARALRSGDDALAAVRAGLTMTSPGDSVRGELLAMLVHLLGERGDQAGVRANAELYVAEGHAARREQMERLIGREP